MALRATKHKFTGETTSITSYDSNKTNLGSLMVQNTGSTPQDKYTGPLPVGITLPMQEVVETVGTVSASATTVTGNATNFTAAMVGMSIGFGSTHPSKITAWYSITVFSSTTQITIGSTAGTIASGTEYVVVSNIPMMYPHVIPINTNIDWLFLIENLATAAAPRKIFLYEYNKTNSIYNWKGFIIVTLTTASAHTIRGFRASRFLHTTGSVEVSGTTVTGNGTRWQGERVALGARIGFGSTNPNDISTWYVVSAIGSNISLTLSTSAGTISSGSLYVIEELRFGIVTTSTGTITNGGLHVVKGINCSDFTKNGTVTIPAATTTDNIKAVYWLCDAGTTANVSTNIAGCGFAIKPEINKGLHYAYVIDGFGSTFARVYRYNLRATGTVTSGKMLLNVSYYKTGTVTVSGTEVTGSGTTFTEDMVGMQIAFGTQGIANVTTWYTIESFTSTTSITLSTSAGSFGGGTLFIIDTADVICTAPQLITGTISAANNGRTATLNHGPGAGEDSLYFVTTTRIYRAALSKIFDGNLGWISDNRPEIPPGSVSTFPATGALSSVEIADTIDRLIVLSTGATAFRHYITRYPDAAGNTFDHIWGIDSKQQDQILALGNAYITSGTVAVSDTDVTGTATFFTSAMVGFRIGFGSTNPNAISTWYIISAFTSITSITLSTSAGTIAGGSAYVIDWNVGVAPHFSTSSQVTSVWSENGIAHIVKHGTTAALSQMYALPLGAHGSYAGTTNQRVISPVIYTPDCTKFNSVAVFHNLRLGDGEFSVNTEPYLLYARTKGITANTGAWTLLPKNGSLDSMIGAPRIQFMFEFDTIGWFNIPARIMGFSVIYDDTDTVTDSHYQPSISKSDAINKRFAWRFSVAFGSNVPKLRVRLYGAINGELLIDDNTTNAFGTWEKTTDGTTWGAYNTTDKGNETTYIRYTPASFGDDVSVRAILTQ